MEQNIETNNISRKKVLFSVFVIIAIVILFFICVILKNGGFKNLSSAKNLFSCAKEGEAIGSSGMPAACCMGLKAVTGIGGFIGDCSSSYAPPGGLSICSKCGDGICNSYAGEDKCNCPKDCEAKDGKSVEKCAGFGQQIDSERKSCCPPLKAINPYLNKDDCSKNSEDIASSITVCDLCGNGICAGFENKCNCPEDCK